MIARHIRSMFVRLDDFRNKDKRLYYLRELDREAQFTHQQILAHQWDRLQQILELAYHHVPFYRKGFESAGVTPKSIHTPVDLLRIPVLVKQDIRRHQQELMNPSFDSTQLFETATGGTTDSPVHLLMDKECLARRRAATLFFFRWLGYSLGDSKALLWGAEQDFPKFQSLKSRIRNWLIERTLYLPSSYLNDKIMYSYYEKLNQFKPKVLQAYPTPLYLFACFLERSGLRLPIKHINVVAEYLYEYQRNKIESVFATKIYNWYGARELGHVATECNIHNGMHINPFGLYLEVIKDGRQVQEEMGELVVTDLLNKAMPLIRYKIGDLGSISYRSCPCGCAFPLIKEVGGRFVDTFKKRDGSFIPGVSLTNRIIKEYNGIEKLQIVQKDFESFQLNIVKGPQYQIDDLENLKERICIFMHERLEFEVCFLDDILPEKSGKVTFCKSLVG